MEKHLYRTNPQLTSAIIDAPITVSVMGRGGGKSSVILAEKSIKMLRSMPGCTIVNIAASYQQILLRTLPALQEGWGKLGYKENVHYFIGHMAPTKLKWPQPKRKPIKPHYSIHWYWGSVLQLASQDIKGSTNGMNIDGVIGDEVKYLDELKFKEEVVPAMRANHDIYGYNASNGVRHTQLHNISFTTDMPTDPRAFWLLDYEKRMDEQRCNAIYLKSKQFEEIRYKIHLSSSDSFKRRLKTELNSLAHTLQLLRLGNVDANISAAVHYQEASSFENIHILKKSYFINALDELGPEIFNTSLRNKRLAKNAVNFYPNLREAQHGYEEWNLDFLKNAAGKQYTGDSRQDADCIETLPLHVSGDYGGSFNGLLAGQDHNNTFKLLKGVHATYPELLPDALVRFKEYYRHHKNKYIYLYYDDTHFGRDGLTSDTYKSTIMSALVKHDQYGSWKVKPVYIGKVPGYYTRFVMWNNLLTGAHDSGYSFRFNRVHCEDWKDSCLLAPLKMGTKGTEKDKTSEKKKPGEYKWSVSQEKATHYSDGGDILMFGFLTVYLKKKLRGRAMA